MTTKDRDKTLNKALDMLLADGFSVKEIADAAQKRDGLIRVVLNQKRRTVIEAVLDYLTILMPNASFNKDEITKEVDEQLKEFEDNIKLFLI